MNAKTWKQLEAEGVRRCCVHFNSGARCRARAVRDSRGLYSWCAKHGPVMDATFKRHMEVVQRDAQRDDADPCDADDNDGES